MAKILVVDDDVDIRESISILLETDGHNVVTAQNRSAGMSAVKLEKPDVIVLDVMMEEPDDGFIMAQDLRRNGIKIPIIMLTGVSKAFGMDFGKDKSIVPVDEFLEKPVVPELLKTKINDILKQQKK